MRGDSFASRVAYSLLTDLDLANWACDSWQAFCELAVSVANAQESKLLLAQKKQASDWPKDPLVYAEDFKRVLFEIQGSAS